MDAFTKTSSGKRIYAWRKETIERSFAEAKELHGLRYARMLGIRNMYEQSFLTAAVQNMKRIARAFRFLFSLLSLCIKGAVSGRKRPFLNGLRPPPQWAAGTACRKGRRSQTLSTRCSEPRRSAPGPARRMASYLYNFAQPRHTAHQPCGAQRQREYRQLPDQRRRERRQRAAQRQEQPLLRLGNQPVLRQIDAESAAPQLRPGRARGASASARRA